MITKIVSLTNFFVICVGFLYARSIISDEDRSKYENVPNSVIENDVGLSGKIMPCPQVCQSGKCDVATVNAECYGIYNSDGMERILTSRRSRRNALNRFDWPKSDDGLIYIPYSFNNQIVEEKHAGILGKAEKEFEKHTCFRLKRRTDEDNYVSIVDQIGCWSMVGKTGGKQYLSLADHCGTLDTVLHEFMHAIGFLHEMSRRDRDKHIKINWPNVNPFFYMQFNITVYGQGFAHGKDYDINSLMHYGNKMAAINSNVNTMTSVKFPGAMLGVRPGATFSEGDKRMINLKGFCGVDIKMHSGPYADSNNGIP